jgi:hypothetical protein
VWGCKFFILAITRVDVWGCKFFILVITRVAEIIVLYPLPSLPSCGLLCDYSDGWCALPYTPDDNCLHSVIVLPLEQFVWRLYCEIVLILFPEVISWLFCYFCTVISWSSSVQETELLSFEGLAHCPWEFRSQKLLCFVVKSLVAYETSKLEIPSVDPCWHQYLLLQFIYCFIDNLGM